MFQYIKEEIKSVLQSKWKLTIFFILPLLVTCYFSILFQQGLIEHARTVIVDQDHSSLSRALIQQFKDNRGFNIVAWETNVSSAQELILQEEADVILHIQEHFSRDLKKGNGSEVTVIANGSNMAICSNALKRASEIILTFSAKVELTVLQGKGFLPRDSMNIAMPVKFHYRQLGNPSGGFVDFLLWGIIGAVGHFPIILLSVTCLKEKEERNSYALIAGKLIAYTSLGTMEILFCVFLATQFFPLSYSGRFLPLLLLTILFVLTSASLGLFLSSTISNQVKATKLAIIIMLPALILSGHTWPLSGFPWYIKILGKIEPLTYYADPLRNLALSGRVNPEYWHSMLILTCMFAFFSIGATLSYGRKVKVWKKEAFSN